MTAVTWDWGAGSAALLGGLMVMVPYVAYNIGFSRGQRNRPPCTRKR